MMVILTFSKDYDLWSGTEHCPECASLYKLACKTFGRRAGDNIIIIIYFLRTVFVYARRAR